MRSVDRILNRKNVRNFRLAQTVLASDIQEGLAPADHLFQNGGQRNSSEKNDIYSSFNSDTMREPRLQYMSESKSLVLDLINDNQAIGFFIKNRVCLTSFAAGVFINLIASLRINKNCYLNFGLPSFIVSKCGTSKARYCVSYDIMLKKEQNNFSFVLSEEKFSGCLKSL